MQSSHIFLLKTFLAPRTAEELPILSPSEWREFLGEDPEIAVQRLENEGLLARATLAHHLDRNFTLSQLRVLEKERNLKTSGRKDEVIQRLIDADHKGMWECIGNLRLLQCSDQGVKKVEQYLQEIGPGEKDHLGALHISADRFKELTKYLVTIAATGVIGNAAYATLTTLMKDIADEIISAPNAAIAPEPETPSSYINRGDTALAEGNCGLAISYYSKAIELDPHEASFYVSRGIAHRRNRDYQAAISDYTQAIALNPDYAEAYLDRGIAYEWLDNHKLAISNYNQAIALNPDYAEAFLNRGTTYARVKDYHAAITDYDRAIALDPKDAEAYRRRGIAHANLKDYHAAIADYNQAIELDPKDAEAYLARGNGYRMAGRKAEAVADYKAYLQRNTNAPDRVYIEQLIRDMQ